MRKYLAAALLTTVAVTMAPPPAAHTQPSWPTSYSTDDPDTPDVAPPDDDVAPDVTPADEDEDEGEPTSLEISRPGFIKRWWVICMQLWQACAHLPH
jgi:hypothetical protein